MASFVALFALLVTAQVVCGMGGKPGGDKPGGKPGGFGPPVPTYALPYMGGREGRDGRDGEKGMKGVKGGKGVKGAMGVKSDEKGMVGDRGNKGMEGTMGVTGGKGTQGSKGSMGMKGQPGEIISGQGVTYVNWGDNSCPFSLGTEFVYSGYAVAPRFDNAGGGAQYLCMDLDNLDNGGLTVMPTAIAQSKLAGVHFDTDALALAEFPLGTVGIEPLAGFDGVVVQCAVCLTSRTDVLVVPNNQECPDNSWFFEYSGYLMAARDYINVPDLFLAHGPVFGGGPSTHFRTEYICVNGFPEGNGPNPNPTDEAKLTHTRIFCADILGLFTVGCSTPQGVPITCDNNVFHCAVGPIGCSVCTIEAEPN